MKQTLILVVVLLSFPIVQAQNWPQFRGHNGQGIATDIGVPVTFGPDQGLLWTCPVDPGVSSPVIWEDHVFLTAVKGDSLETICIDRLNGEIRWIQSVVADRLERVHPISSPAAPSVATNGKQVISYFGSYGLLCYDLQGTLLWERKIPQQGNMYGVSVSPVFWKGVLIFSRDANESSYLETIDPETGKTIWHTDRPGFKANWSTPSVLTNDNRDEILVYGIWWLKAYDFKTGEELWSFPGLTDEPCTTPVIANGLVYVTTYNMKTNPEVLGLPTWDSLLQLYDENQDSMLSLLEARKNQSILSRYDADGEGDHPLWGFHRWLDEDKDGQLTETEWQKMIAYIDSFQQDNALLALRPPRETGKDPEKVWRHEYGVPECPSPVYHKGLIYMVKNGGILSCLDAATGELKYQEKLDAGGPYYASPIYADSHIYCTTSRGIVTVIEASDSFRVVAQNDLKERIMATPAIADGKIYIRTQEHLMAFGSN